MNAECEFDGFGKVLWSCQQGAVTLTGRKKAFHGLPPWGEDTSATWDMWRLHRGSEQCGVFSHWPSLVRLRLFLDLVSN
jgi:hypothetical protein